MILGPRRFLDYKGPPDPREGRRPLVLATSNYPPGTTSPYLVGGGLVKAAAEKAAAGCLDGLPLAGFHLLWLEFRHDITLAV